MKEEFLINLTQAFHQKGIVLTEGQKENFYKYFQMLVEWNNKFNLTTITSPTEVIYKHFLDSVMSIQFIPNGAKVLDIGAGAGFPSLPIKILRPDIKLVMLDSVNKKVIFLQEVANQLNLQNINALHTRAEDLALKKDYRETFDIVVSRAVSRLNTLCEYSLPFVKIGGKMIAYKSVDTQEEVSEALTAIKILGGDKPKVQDVSFEDANRTLVLINKKNITPLKYPRGGNKPRLQPLI